jgi:hypothetical protein
MQNVFIGIGGSGTRVAEALIRLLAIGFPTRNDNGVFTSTDDSLQIWRVDPDRSSGAAVSLQSCIDSYKALQECLGTVAGDSAQSRWSMDLDVKIRNLDPLLLGRADGDTGDAKPYDAKTLREILDSKDRGKNEAGPFLDLFYETKDLDVRVDKGFYQKPFIGAGVMAIFADSLADGRSPGGSQCQLVPLASKEVRFFLCGSLHGGTGACGVPILGRFLNEYRSAKHVDNWHLAGCLMAPYCVPPAPPFKKLKNPAEMSDAMIEEYLREHGDHPVFAGLVPEQKVDLIRQILLGFYADPEELRARARQGLVYYKDHSSAYFDQLYLLGKPEPDELRIWSNGGKTQQNPLNSAEVAAAIAALNYFSDTRLDEKEAYIIGTSTEKVDSRRMHLYDLPRYSVGSVKINPERVFLASLILRHLLVYQIRWDLEASHWVGIDGLRAHYLASEQRKNEDQVAYMKAAGLLSDLVFSVVRPDQTLGWDGEDAMRIQSLLSDKKSEVDELTNKLAKKGFFGKEAKDPIALGKSSIRVSTLEFGEWCPPSESYGRGEYLRFVWSKLFTKGWGNG